MGKTNTVLILVIVAAVNLSNGHSLTKNPSEIKSSFSGSSSSSSAFAHSSSSSYTFNGPIDPNDLENLKASAAVGAAAGAAAGAGVHSVGGAAANAVAGAHAGSFAGSGSFVGGSGGDLSSLDAGSGAASGVISGSDSGCAKGNTGCGETQDTNQIGISTAPVDTGAYKIINTNQYNTGYNSAPQGTNYVVAGQYVQDGEKSAHGCPTCKGPFPGPAGSIHDYKPVSSVHKGTQAAANADSTSYYQPPKGTSNFPVAPGNIYTSKPVTSNLSPAPSNTYANKPATDILPPAPSTVYHGTTSHASGHGQVNPSLIGTFPGPSGSIYDSKPVGAGVGDKTDVGTGTGAGAVAISGSGSYYGDSGIDTDCKYSGSSNKNCGGSVSSGHSAETVPVLPGPSGSIYDSKPAHGAGAGAVAEAGAGAFTNTGSYYGDSGFDTGCKYSSGSSNKNCGGSVSSGQIAGTVPVLPGPSGSIYDSKPAHGAGSGAGTGTYSNSGSATNIPSSHAIAAPACSSNPASPNYCGVSAFNTEQDTTPGSSIAIVPILPGPSGSIYSSKPATSVPSHTSAGEEAQSGAGAASHVNFGSVSNIPSSHPVVGPICTYTPGSPNKCGGENIPQDSAVAGAGAFAQANAAGCPTCKGPFPGPSGSIHDYKLVSSPTSGGAFGFHSGAGAHVPILSPSFGCPTCKGPFPGPSGSIHDYKLVSSPTSGGAFGFHSGAGAHVPILSPSFGSHLPVPSIHPELPTSAGTYYVNKPASSSKDVQAPLLHSVPSFTGQIPCSDSTCESAISNQAAAGSLSGSYTGAQSGSQNNNVIFVNNDKADVYSNLNHDAAHESGNIVFDNGNGKYYEVPTENKPSVKNADHGGYAVSTDEAENTGFVIGPGTGHLPIETDAKPFGTQGYSGGSAAFGKGTTQNNDNTIGAHGTFDSSGLGPGSTDDKPFGTQGAFGGSAAFAKGSSSVQNSGLITSSGQDNKSFGSQGAFGGSSAFAKGSAAAQNSGNQFIDTRPCAYGDCSSSGAGDTSGLETGDVIIQKVDGTLVSSVDDTSYKPGCSSGACGSGFNSNTGISYNTNQGVISKGSGNSVKLECTGESCGDTEVYIIEDKPSNSGTYGSGCSSGVCGGSGSGSGSGSGFATGQVLVQKGSSTTYDVTNQGASYSGLNAGSSSGNQYGVSGCSTGQCGGSGFGISGSFGLGSSGGLINKLFGTGGLSGNLNKFSGGGFGGSSSYSNAGTYSSASAGSFASASASAHAGSFAHSF